MKEFFGVINEITGEDPPVVSKLYKIVVTEKEIKEKKLKEEFVILYAYEKMKKILSETKEFKDCMQIIPIENISIIV